MLQLTSMDLTDYGHQEPHLTSLRGLEAASGLRRLRLSCLCHLTNIAAVAAMTALTQLYISSCDRLQELPPGLGRLLQLESLEMINVQSLSTIRELDRLVSLRTLAVQSIGEPSFKLTRPPQRLRLKPLKIPNPLKAQG